MPQNILDRPGIDRSNQQCIELCNLLVVAYNINESKHLLMSIGLEEGDLPINYKNLREFWWLALEIVANQQGKLRVLVQKTAADPAKSAHRNQFEAFLTSEPATNEGTQGSLLPMRELRDLPFNALPEGVREMIALFETRRRDYEGRRDQQTGRS